MKAILKIIGLITSILAVLAGIKLVLGKFCKKNCEDCDDEAEDGDDIIAVDAQTEDTVEESYETATEADETFKEEQGE